jgi:segregation and condensation protein B
MTENDTTDTPADPNAAGPNDALADDNAPPAGEGAPDPVTVPPVAEPMEEGPALPPQEIRAILEALVFASAHPVTPREIGQVLGGVAKEIWLDQMDRLKEEYAREGKGLQLVEVAGGYQITTRPEYNDWVRELLNPKTPTRLSVQALETLAVIAYKQPVTMPEVIELRGVKSGGVIKTLLEKRLIRIVGRKEVVGRPMLYGTTKDFLLHFGLKDLSELPKIEEFAQVLGEEVDIDGLKKAIESPTPSETPLADEQGVTSGTLPFGDEAGDDAPDAEDATPDTNEP